MVCTPFMQYNNDSSVKHNKRATSRGATNCMTPSRPAVPPYPPPALRCPRFRSPSAPRRALTMPSTARAAPASASAPLHHACVHRRLTPSCFLPSRAILNSARLTALGPALPLVHAPRMPPTAVKAAARSPTSGGQMLVRIWFCLCRFV
jgi:hypothetical protein